MLRKKGWKEFVKEEPHLAKFLSYYILTGAFTAILSYQPFFNVIAYLGMYVGRKNSWSAAAAFSSGMLNLWVVLPIMFIMLASTGFEEDEMEDFLLYKLRRIPIYGFGASISLTTLMYLFGILSSNESMRYKAGKSLRSAVPGGLLLDAAEKVKDTVTE
jgi:hypothetical protein